MKAQTCFVYSERHQHTLHLYFLQKILSLSVLTPVLGIRCLLTTWPVSCEGEGRISRPGMDVRHASMAKRSSLMYTTVNPFFKEPTPEMRPIMAIL